MVRLKGDSIHDIKVNTSTNTWSDHSSVGMPNSIQTDSNGDIELMNSGSSLVLFRFTPPTSSSWSVSGSGSTNSPTPPVFDNAQVGGNFMGRWGAKFDGASNDNELKADNYTNSFGTGEQKYTIFCSTYWDGGTSNDTMFAIGRTDTNRNVAYHPNSSGTANHYHYSADVTGTGISDETSLTLCLRYSGGGSNSTNMKQWFDTTLQSGSGSTSSGLNLESDKPLRIGGYSTRGSSHNYEGRIFNFIALRTDRTDSEVTDIIGKLNTY